MNKTNHFLVFFWSFALEEKYGLSNLWLDVIIRKKIGDNNIDILVCIFQYARYPNIWEDI